MLSTLAQADATHTALRKQQDGTRAPVQCTDTVVLYNQYMDKGDQLRRVRTRCRKYYKYIFWFMFDVAITNSYILSLFAPTTLPLSHQRLKSFRLRLAVLVPNTYPHLCQHHTTLVPYHRRPHALLSICPLSEIAGGGASTVPSTAIHQRCQMSCGTANNARANQHCA